MQARSSKEIASQEEVGEFDQLCALARNCDKAALFQFLYEENLTIDITSSGKEWPFNHVSVVMKMAEEGNHQAVKLLIDTFHADPVDAAEGYAIARNVDKVEEFLRECNAMNAVARGYGVAGDAERVANMLKRGASASGIVYGAACAGHHDLVDSLLKTCDNSRKALKHAYEGYARSGDIERMEAMILHALKIHQSRHDSPKGLKKLFKHHDALQRFCEDAIWEYAGSGCLFDENKEIKLLSLTNNDAMRKHFIDAMKRHPGSFHRGEKLTQLINKAADIRTAMANTPDLTFEAALAAWASPAKPEPVKAVVEEAVAVPPAEAASAPVKIEKVEEAVPAAEAPKPEVVAEAEVKPEPKQKNIFGWFHKRQKPAAATVAVADAAPVVEEKSAVPAPGK